MSSAVTHARPPAPTDVGHRLRRLRRRRGMTLAALAGLTGVSISYIAMVERGERTLTRLDWIIAMADALRVPVAELAPVPIPAHEDLRPSAPSPAPAFPARTEATMTLHARLAGELLTIIARGDTRAAGIWLRRTARDPAASPWLLLDLLAAHYARTPGYPATKAQRSVGRTGDAPLPGRTPSPPGSGR
jgi:transcriptional regulator with XRE-family HTH domain